MLAKLEDTFRLQFVIDIIVRNCLGCQSVICDVLVEFQYCVVMERAVAPWYSVYPGWDGSSDRSLMAECNL